MEKQKALRKVLYMMYFTHFSIYLMLLVIVFTSIVIGQWIEAILKMEV